MKKNELEFFRKILNERKEQIIQNINSSVDDIRGLKDSSDASDEIDVASVDTDTTLGYAMIQNLSQELKEIDESPKRTVFVKCVKKKFPWRVFVQSRRRNIA